MTGFSRQLIVERASVDQETGEFRGVLATDGEASDGHILNIAGGEIPERMPLFVNHEHDPRTQIGSLFYERRTAHQLYVRGQILIDGFGQQAEIRRDLMLKLAHGHIGRLSILWDQTDWDGAPRVQLPKEHPAYLSPAKARKNPRARNGIYFSRWVAKEGSMVGIGSDPAALARFSTDPNVSEPVRAFWRSMQETTQHGEAQMGDENHEVIEVAQGDEPQVPSERADDTEEVTAEPEDDAKPLTMRDMESFVSELASIVRQAVDARIDERLPAPSDETTDEPAPQDGALLERISGLERKLEELEAQGREPREPAPRLTPERFVRILEQGLDQKTEHVLAAVEAFIAQKRGKVSELEALRDRAVAEATEVISRRLGIKAPANPEPKPQPLTMSELTQRLNDSFKEAQERLAKRIESVE